MRIKFHLICFVEALLFFIMSAHAMAFSYIFCFDYYDMPYRLAFTPCPMIYLLLVIFGLLLILLYSFLEYKRIKIRQIFGLFSIYRKE